MRRPLSLALRLTLLFSISAAIAFSAFGWVIVQSTENHFKEQDGDELVVIADAVQAALLEIRTPQDITFLEPRFADILVGHHDASLYVAGPDGKALYASEGPDLSAVLRPVPNGSAANSVRAWNDADRSYRVLTESVYKRAETTSGPYAFAVAVPIDDHVRFLASFRRNLSLLIVGSIALMSLMGWIAVRQGHVPLHGIVEQIRHIRADELAVRLSPDDVPAELTELAISFNEMLERVDEAFHRLSDFNADIAHELRTPIANLMTQTEVGLSRARTADEYREILYSNMEEYQRMAQMVGDMLFLAQSDNRQQEGSIAEFELTNEFHDLFEFYEGWADECDVKLDLTGTAKTTGDRRMLRRALSNLLSNAIRHSPPGATIRVNLNVTETGETRISIANPGPTIPAEHLPRLFDRFYRIDRSRQQSDEGVGLGLAIVKSIVNAHDGRIDVVSDNGCTQFVITLPAHSVSDLSSE